MGFKRRNMAAIGIGKRNKKYRDGGHARLQLGPYEHTQKDGTSGWNRVLPNRGVPKRVKFKKGN